METLTKKPDSKCENHVMKKVCELTGKFDSQLANISFYKSDFDGCPKVHKSKQIKKWFCNKTKDFTELYEPNDSTVKPILEGLHCPTKPLSELIDIILKPFLIHIKNYIKDNSNFLKKYYSGNNGSNILVIFDVKNLYTGAYST